jgi:hypothetical protein
MWRVAAVRTKNRVLLVSAVDGLMPGFGGNGLRDNSAMRPEEGGFTGPTSVRGTPKFRVSN